MLLAYLLAYPAHLAYEHPLHLMLILDFIMCRAETAVIAALLHDVADDTKHDLAEIRDRFGSAVADIAHHVSRLSDVNQLLRRQLRHEVS